MDWIDRFLIFSLCCIAYYWVTKEDKQPATKFTPQLKPDFKNDIHLDFYIHHPHTQEMMKIDGMGEFEIWLIAFDQITLCDEFGCQPYCWQMRKRGCLPYYGITFEVAMAWFGTSETYQIVQSMQEFRQKQTEYGDKVALCMSDKTDRTRGHCIYYDAFLQPLWIRTVGKDGYDRIRGMHSSKDMPSELKKPMGATPTH